MQPADEQPFLSRQGDDPRRDGGDAHRAFGYPATAENRFIDDNGHLFEDAINRIAAAGVTLGCNPPANDRFCPDQIVARDQMATIPDPCPRAHRQPPPAPAGAGRVRGVTVEWGARPPQLDRMVPQTITRLTIHHAGDQVGATAPHSFGAGRTGT